MWVIHERSKQQTMSTNLLRYWNISNGRLWDRNVTSKEINKYNNGKAKEVWKHTVYKATEWSFVIVYWPSFFCDVMQTVDGTDGYCTYATFRWHTSTSAPLAHGHLRKTKLDLSVSGHTGSELWISRLFSQNQSRKCSKHPSGHKDKLQSHCWIVNQKCAECWVMW